MAAKKDDKKPFSIPFHFLQQIIEVKVLAITIDRSVLSASTQ